LESVSLIDDDVGAQLAAVFREAAGSLTGALARYTGDFGLAEECVQDALVRALERWPRDGIPERPAAWLMTVARHRALDRLRRHRHERVKLALAGAGPPTPSPDDRLGAIFTCCHPALAREAQLALTLQAVCGFTAAQIAGALLCSEAAVNQRVSRARRKIAAAGIAFRAPEPEELDERLSEVLAVVYLMFNEGYLSAAGGRDGELAHSRDLSEDAAWLGSLLVRLYPQEPEPIGLLALMRLHLARTRARFDGRGELVLLADQDRTRWDRAMIAEAISLIERAAAMHRPGPYQLQAAIVACHAEAPSVEATDWAQVLVLYDMLLALAPSPIARLNRAVAVARVHGASAGLAELDQLEGALGGYHLLHAVRGRLLHELGDLEQARAAELQAAELTANRAEQSLLRRRVGLGSAPSRSPTATA
jgi:RNA polymerase sigma factor (sigma-70 family)